MVATRRKLTRLAPLAGSAAAAAAAALLVAGCGGSSGPQAAGATPDAKTAAAQLLAALQPTTPGLRSVKCGPLDFALTYRCTVRTRDAALVCGARSGTTTKPYCVTEAENTAEVARRAAVVGAALRRVNQSGRLAKSVTDIRRGGFTVGCVLGFRTVAGGSAQTDDVVVELLPVQTESGRSFWEQFIVRAKTGAIGVGKGFDPGKKAGLNGYAGCALDEQGQVAARGEPRDSTLLPAAPAA
jgi:hypothetical protein